MVLIASVSRVHITREDAYDGTPQFRVTIPTQHSTDLLTLDEAAQLAASFSKAVKGAKISHARRTKK